MPSQLPHQFDARTLTEVITARKPLPGLFKELFFRTRNKLPSKFAELEVLVRGRSLVPFVTDYEGGTLSPKTKRELRTVKTPRVNPIERFSAPELIDVSRPGQGPYRNTPEDLDAAIEETIVRDLDAIKDDIELTIEFMCAQAVKGGLSVVQEGVKVLDIDFLMPSEHKIVLGDGVRWNQDDGDPEANFEDWAALILNAAGVGADVCVMGTNAWRAFKGNAKIKDDLDRRRIEIGSLSPDVNKLRKGEYNGLDIYSYGGEYEDLDGTVQHLLHPDYVLLGSTSARCSIEFGVPEDLKNHGKPNEYFAKAWEEENPSAYWMGVESRPLPFPKQSGGFVYAKVL